jgi:heme/copper-type cytochrome/quinol oxidase subunit 2
VKLTTHLHPVPRSKNEWRYTSTPNTPSWRGAQFKHRDFTFIIIIIIIIVVVVVVVVVVVAVLL